MSMPVEEKLGRLITFPTTAGTPDYPEDASAFEGCRGAIHQLYPQVAGACERQVIFGRGLVYHWRGKAKGKPWVLMAHYDVVPAPPEGWERPPFSGDVADGFIHGRGAVDTKGTLAAMLQAAEELIGEGFTPEQDIYFCFSGDEETYGPTTGRIIAWLKERDALPYAVLDEGGQVERGAAPGVSSLCAMVGVAEKGMAQVQLSVFGPGGHASRPPRESQADILARALVRLNKHPFPMRIASPVKEALSALSRGSAWPYQPIYRWHGLFSPLIKRFASRQAGSIAALFRTTCAVTQLKGSDASNVLPVTATAGLNLRLMPGDSLEGVVTHLRQVIGDSRVKAGLVTGNGPSPVSEMGGPAFERIRDAASAVWPGVITLPALMVGATDAYHYSAFCPRVYRFSPLRVPPEITAAVHAANERLPVAALHEAVAFYRAFITAQ
ncbi:MAG: M20/M25/M40 family metallo-hydrolase [Eubacteriales bacterium]|nr:M20/M25/M40 family metallo-hydrolase [Eubacteriales bacterium]